VTPWRTPNDSFYLIHTALIPPAIEPKDWQLRIHGMVDREVVLTYADLMAREPPRRGSRSTASPPRRRPVDRQRLVERRPLPRPAAGGRRQAGRRRRAQTSDDGWTCGTPLAALTDDRDAMLAIAMNGQALPIDTASRSARSSRPVRLRVGLQVGGRLGGEQVRGHLGVLDAARLG
jgi:DMSO/TMAO reductase YedYZ molybdopterin-dependent catalytic subunit